MAIIDRVAREALMMGLAATAQSLEISESPFEQANEPGGAVVKFEHKGLYLDGNTGQELFTLCFAFVVEDQRVVEAISKFVLERGGG